MSPSHRNPMSLQIRDFDYHLPAELIAQAPARQRDQSRLMVVRRETATIEHHIFRDLPDILGHQDLLVLNDTRVFRARLLGRRANGAQVEVLLLRQREERVWEALVRPGRRVKNGSRLIFQPGVFEAVAVDGGQGALRWLRFEFAGDLWGHVERLGHVPLPPYIGRSDGSTPTDAERYQTVYARDRGSIAAPTAGLHFTPEILERVPHRFLTLHVGYGTFKPVSSDLVREHRMEPEFFSVGEETAHAIRDQLQSGRKVTAVGTTATRTLEHLAVAHGRIQADQGWTDLFIYPGHEFKVVGSLVTNFHLPRSTLLLLVSAFAGTELIRECYREAIGRKYRFYSYGDAMLIL